MLDIHTMTCAAEMIYNKFRVFNRAFMREPRGSMSASVPAEFAVPELESGVSAPVQRSRPFEAPVIRQFCVARQPFFDGLEVRFRNGKYGCKVGHSLLLACIK